jgi:hypothetical protein
MAAVICFSSVIENFLLRRNLALESDKTSAVMKTPLIDSQPANVLMGRFKTG